MVVFSEWFLKALIVVALAGVAGGGVYLLTMLWKDLKKRKVW